MHPAELHAKKRGGMAAMVVKGAVAISRPFALVMRAGAISAGPAIFCFNRSGRSLVAPVCGKRVQICPREPEGKNEK